MNYLINYIDCIKFRKYSNIHEVIEIYDKYLVSYRYRKVIFFRKLLPQIVFSHNIKFWNIFCTAQNEIRICIHSCFILYTIISAF